MKWPVYYVRTPWTRLNLSRTCQHPTYVCKSKLVATSIPSVPRAPVQFTTAYTALSLRACHISRKRQLCAAAPSLRRGRALSGGRVERDIGQFRVAEYTSAARVILPCSVDELSIITSVPRAKRTDTQWKCAQWQPLVCVVISAQPRIERKNVVGFAPGLSTDEAKVSFFPHVAYNITHTIARSLQISATVRVLRVVDEFGYVGIRHALVGLVIHIDETMQIG